MSALVDKNPSHSFTVLDTPVSSLVQRQGQLLQYNLDKNLQITRFRYSGALSQTAAADYEDFLRDFFSAANVLSVTGISGTVATPVEVTVEPVNVSVMSMEFFDRLEASDIISTDGRIRGCFEETFEGVTVSDKLREMLLNESSENADLFGSADKTEFIYHIFKLFVIGGSMCQTDEKLENYLGLVKDFYKDMVTIYRDAKTSNVQIAGRTFKVMGVAGLDIFPGQADNPNNSLFVVIDPLKKTATAIKNTYRSFW